MPTKAGSDDASLSETKEEDRSPSPSSSECDLPPVGDLIDLRPPTPDPSEPSDDSEKPKPGYAGSSHTLRGPRLSQAEGRALATRFAAAIPERMFSMASLQGHLMRHKTRPLEAVERVDVWVAEELAGKEPQRNDADGLVAPAAVATA
ncbi:hypothetical protein OBBRIDRAFT_892113 [Obba rivulosa]|uniref:Mitochondrial chaperone BCS1-like ATPase lid domain-containing protein n=1 Tax=Obba rivulosa TaxID=1052685 RepID=A0A8E2AGA1_9APHY|nr:hypothetical protein OBBRIDRAFT_892113 [Obba rivulosa]